MKKERKGGKKRQRIRSTYSTGTASAIYNKVPSERLKSASATHRHREATKRIGGSEHSSRIVALRFELSFAVLLPRHAVLAGLPCKSMWCMQAFTLSFRHVILVYFGLCRKSASNKEDTHEMHNANSIEI